MPQSGLGSMQGSNEDSLPMKGHTRGGGRPTHSVTNSTDTQRGGTHPQCNPTNRHTNFLDTRNKQTKRTKPYIEAACCLKTQTCKQEYASARNIEPYKGLQKEKNFTKRNMSLLFVHAWAMPRTLYLSCGIPFPV